MILITPGKCNLYQIIRQENRRRCSLTELALRPILENQLAAISTFVLPNKHSRRVKRLRGGPHLQQSKNLNFLGKGTELRKELHPKKFRGMRKGLKNMVARDGVEPPTPAFSVCKFRVATTT